MSFRIAGLLRFWPTIRLLGIVEIAMAVFMLAPASPAVAASAADLSAFLAAYRCDVVERLLMIHANQTSKDDRFLIIGLQGAPEETYVQCLFNDDDSKIFCEAASGFYLQKAGEPRRSRVTPQALAALARLGFSTDDSKGNYRRMMDLTGPSDFTVIADLMLSALYQGYGAGLDSRLIWEAPLAPGKGTFARCAPLS
jgi:hypothetical protein